MNIKFQLFYSKVRKYKKWLVILFCILSWFTYSKSIFRFQHFNEGEKTEIYLKQYFPNGSDGKILVKVLKRAGADCIKVSKPNDLRMLPKGTTEYWFCDYGHWQLSIINPAIRHYVGVYMDSKEQILGLYAGRDKDVL